MEGVIQVQGYSYRREGLTRIFFPMRVRGVALSGASSLTSAAGIVAPGWMWVTPRRDAATLWAAEARMEAISDTNEKRP